MKQRDILILDYGSGNIGSLVNMFRYIGSPVRVVTAASDVYGNAALVLPGVGHFGRASEKLDQSGLAKVVISHVEDGNPLLGVCVGMQLLFEHSSEGDTAGLGLIKGQVRHFDRARFAQHLPLPNVGWRHVVPKGDVGTRLLANMPSRPRFYFVHSYHAECSNANDVIMECDYGYRFTSAVARANVTGFQFHPEKSHNFGLTLLVNWIKSIND